MNTKKTKKNIYTEHYRSAFIKTKKVFVGMSGGVDSSVAALLLQQQDYEVVGCFIRGWYPSGLHCSWREDRRDAMRICAKLGIPFITIDGEKEYKKEVVDYMVSEFKVGRTPNPDVMCNKHIKFGIFLNQAKKMGADFIATGHYVKIKNSKISIAKDLNKDQSYFLWALNTKQIKDCLFPLGDLIKPEVKEIARKNHFATADKQESMGVCFIGEFDISDFLKRYIKPKKGKIITTEGVVVGEHEGVEFYTIGQRHGFSKGGGVPYYVVNKDIKKNILIVADKAREEDFYKKEIELEKINWLAGKAPTQSKTYQARIRYRQPLQNCRLETKKGKVLVKFSKPQRAVTPGQSVVIYSGKEMLGGGVIK
jgi:tRNA-specific 2-thiouridylase